MRSKAKRQFESFIFNVPEKRGTISSNYLQYLGKSLCPNNQISGKK